MRVGQDGSAARSLVLLDVRFVPPGEAPRSITLSIVDRPRPLRPRPSVRLLGSVFNIPRWTDGRMHAYTSIWPHFHARGHVWREAGERARFYILGPSIKLRTTAKMRWGIIRARIASQVNTERASGQTNERTNERVDRRVRGGRWLVGWLVGGGGGGGMQIA